MLGQAAVPVGSPEVFARELTAMIRQGQTQTARHWLRFRFEEAERLLISPGDTPEDVLMFLASRWDERSAGPGGWLVLTQDRLERGELYDAFEASYLKWQSLARSGRFDVAAAEEIRSPLETSVPWLDVESHRLQAIALLTSGDPDGAANQWISAANLAEPWSPRLAKQLRLMAASAWVSDQQFDRADEAWREATARVTIYDLDSAATLALMIQIQDRLSALGGPGVISSRLLHHRLGELRLARGEPQAALVAFRKAESQLGADPTRSTLRLAQADALMALGQRDTARAVLAELTDSPQRVDALGRLGVIELRSGRVAVGQRLLRTATEEVAIEDHPQIYADYALALLAVGQTDKGLEIAARAREYFRLQDNFLATKRSLTNEKILAQAAGQSDRVLTLDAELKALERGINRDFGRLEIP
ncbi:MAG: hypothetical protein AAGH99_09310 [Planctomycetota bacterium]